MSSSNQHWSARAAAAPPSSGGMPRTSKSHPSSSSSRWFDSASFQIPNATRAILGAPFLRKRRAHGGGPLPPIPVKTLLGVTTLALYLLNQKGWLPPPLSGVVSKVLFWPTLPITVARRIGQWTTVIDDAVVMGGAPFGFVGLPETLYHEYRVRAVVNLCDEYEGPLQHYQALGIKQLRLPTLDHHCPSVHDLEAAVAFVQQQQRPTQQGDGRVYIHCRAGHGRSAAVVYCWLLAQNPTVDRRQLNEQFRLQRFVKDTLWKEPAIVEFHERLLNRLQHHRLPRKHDEAANPDDPLMDDVS